MDQLLPYPKNSISVPLPKERRSATQKKFFLPKFPVITLPNFLERRSRLDPVIFLTVALSLCSTGILASLYGPSYQVAVEGEKLGLVDNYQDVENAILRVEDRASDILGYEYTLHRNVEYTFQVALKEDRMPLADVETFLFDQIGEVMKTSVIRVNGQMLGAVDDGAALDDMLLSIKAPYITENTLSANFVEPLTVTREYTATTALRDIEDMRQLLTSNTMERLDYTVQPGDTFSGIAARLDMTMEDLQDLNPSVDINELVVGQVLTTRQAVPYLSVRTVNREIYEGSIPYTVETVNDDTMYQGNSKILVPGVEGSATYTANVTYVNGSEQNRAILDTQVHSEPIAQVVAVGTKPRPKTMATGKFIWPLWGQITSGFGSRYIFGSYSFHSGIDIHGSHGAAIVAADGGKVVFAGTGRGSFWSYGNYVEIDHENGLHTIYAHCSSLNVRVGDRVYQGQTIARVGATGRATGNHLHFQVKRNGETVNPYNYLP